LSAAAWPFLAGWVAASAFIGIGALFQHRRRQRWLDAQDSELFASACQRYTETRGI